MKTHFKDIYSWKKTTSSAVFLLAGVMVFSQSSISIASAEDVITSVSKADCSVTAGYTVTLGGNFASPIQNVWVQGQTFDIQIPGTDWSQTPTSVVVKIPASDTKSFIIRTYNGGAVLSKEFNCTEAVVIAPPVIETEDVTEDGGLLPDTATNNYNYLAAGLGLALVGSAGLLRRRVIKE